MARILSRLRQARHRFSVASLFHSEPPSNKNENETTESDTAAMGATNHKTQYDAFAPQYHQGSTELPHSILESELIREALGDCTDYRVLDLAGGSGNHARIAIEAGAAQVDLIDISASMMEVGEEVETKAGRDVVRWILADISRPLWEQAVVPSLPREEYDLVLAVWSWDHVSTPEQYTEVWRNVSAYLKPGGRLVGCRVRNPWSPCVQDGKYGARVKLTEPIPGGVKSEIVVYTKPPFEFESTAMEESLRGDTKLPASMGIGDIKSVEADNLDCVKKDPEFWKDFLDDPYFVVFTAKKQDT